MQPLNTPYLQELGWETIRDEVNLINPKLTEIIDRLSPDKSFPLFKVSYPYGCEVIKNGHLMLPNKNNQLVPITDSSINSHTRELLNYNLNSNPVSLVLGNSFELYLTLKDRTVPRYGLIQPGTIFGAWRIFQENPEEVSQPLFLWSMTAGARSIFMLPKVTESKKHLKLKKYFGLTLDEPRRLIEHWNIFREIANHPDFTQPWQAEMLYFSKPWFEKMHDSAWYEFFYYILHYAWKHSEYWRGRITWNLIFSIIADDRFIKSSAYINDTARTLLAIGSGQHPGFAPAINNISGPIEGIQNVYKNIYGLNKYPPVVVHLERFNMKDTASRPVYYPLQYPTAIELGKKNRARDSLITDLHEIRSALIQYKRDIMSDKFNITGTALEKLFHVVEYSYFHNNVDLHTGMQNSSMMAKEDPHLLQLVNDESYGVFPEMCSFVKGCIRISRKIDI